MKDVDHLRRAENLKESIRILTEQDSDENVAAIVELIYGVAQHLIAYGMEKRHGTHKDTHVGMAAQLRSYGADDVAIAFERLDTFRHGRWYGSKGNGDIVNEGLKLIEEIERWARI
jgi:hypothetical protein